MDTTRSAFVQSLEPEPHKARRKAILSEHPEVRQLIGRNPYSFLIIVSIVSVQITMAWLLHDQPWWLIIAAAWLFGAFANHSLFVLLHECAHNLIFKKQTWNLWASILATLPAGFPSSIGFRKYHLKHHAFQGVYDLDADLANEWEARLIGKSSARKILWLLFFPLFQGLRPPRLKEIKFNDKWTWIEATLTFGFDALIVVLWGPWALVYLLASLVFSIGLHPLGARWIQEHYLVKPPQETYSYYGPLNLIAMNVGYHNEHHDIPSIPWNRLPKLREMAPEFYNTLYYHTSWTKLWIKFIFDSNLDLHSRAVRENRAGVPVLQDH